MSVNIKRSQQGGENIFKALSYQKKYIAYLAMLMKTKKHPIKKIICESNNDIEVIESDSSISQYQVKTTKNTYLNISEIKESINLFLSNYNINPTIKKFVIVSTAPVNKIPNEMATEYQLIRYTDRFKQLL
jgi:primase-polymerase (primpol)-like protein